MNAAAEIRLNDHGPLAGTLTVERDILTETTNLPAPDPCWSMVDAAGHFHAAAREMFGQPGHDGKAPISYPTLTSRSEHRECDGSCGGVCGGEGYHVTLYACRICGADVEPGSVAGPHTVSFPGRYEWRVEVTGGRELTDLYRQTVTVRATLDNRSVVGVALGADMTVGGGSDGIRARLTLIGSGPLGQVSR